MCFKEAFLSCYSELSIEEPTYSLCKRGWDSQVPGVDVKEGCSLRSYIAVTPQEVSTPPPVCENKKWSK